MIRADDSVVGLFCSENHNQFERRLKRFAAQLIIDISNKG